MTDHLKTIRELLPALSLGSVTAYKAVKAALDALEQAMREPCAWIEPDDRVGNWTSFDSISAYRTPKAGWRPVYLAAPPAQQAQAEWVPTCVPGECKTVDLCKVKCQCLIRNIQPAQQAQAEAVQWGVDWGTHGDRTCVSIIKKRQDGTIEVVASEYEPDHSIRKQAEAFPEWLTYDPATDVLTIHGKRYSAGMFGEEGFLAPPGTLLRVEDGGPGVVMLTRVRQAEAAPELTGCNCRWRGDEVVARCELHEAWHVAIHEWAERAKAAEAKQAEAVRHVVGDSRFESWYSEDFDPKGKGTKQHMREAYEAGMNDPLVKRAEAVPSFTLDDPDLHNLLNAVASIAEGQANHDIGMMYLQALERVQERLVAPKQAEAVPLDVTKIIDAAVGKFLGWKLPFDFAPDAGISYDRSYRDKWGLPIGTNLFTAQQAKYMFECCLRDALSGIAAAPQPKEQSNGN